MRIFEVMSIIEGQNTELHTKHQIEMNILMVMKGRKQEHVY